MVVDLVPFAPPSATASLSARDSPHSSPFGSHTRSLSIMQRSGGAPLLILPGSASAHQRGSSDGAGGSPPGSPLTRVAHLRSGSTPARSSRSGGSGGSAGSGMSSLFHQYVAELLPEEPLQHEQAKVQEHRRRESVVIAQLQLRCSLVAHVMQRHASAATEREDDAI